MLASKLLWPSVFLLIFFWGFGAFYIYTYIYVGSMDDAICFLYPGEGVV